MLTLPQQQEFADRFPFILNTQPAFQKEFFNSASYLRLSPDSTICEEGHQCTQLALMLQGVGRVFKISASGREITLYRIYPGESCVLTASCIMNGDSFPAIAETETDSPAVIVSKERVKSWFCQDAEWQKFVFRLLSSRLASIITVVEEVAFKRIDVRLAEQFARHLHKGESTLLKTHAELAADVGSSREVVTRILRDFVQREMIRLSRGSIELVDQQKILQLSRDN